MVRRRRRVPINLIEKFVNEYQYERDGKKFGYSDLTKDDIKKSFKDFEDAGEKLGYKSLSQFFEDKDAFLKHLDSVYKSFETKKKKLGNVSSFLKWKNESQDSIYTTTLKDYNKQLSEIGAKKKPEGKTDDYLDKIGEITNSKDKLLFTMYVKYPPRRSDYFSIKVRNVDKSKDNYFDFKKKRFVFNSLVKVNKNDAYTEVDVETSNLVKEVMDSHDKDYLFVDKTGNEYNNKAFSNYIKRNSEKYFGKKLTINDFRRLYSNDKLEGKKGVDAVNEALKNAEGMGHSIKTQARYYLNKVEEENSSVLSSVLDEGTSSGGAFVVGGRNPPDDAYVYINGYKIMLPKGFIVKIVKP